MSSRFRFQNATTVALLILLSGAAVRTASGGLVLQEVMNNSAATMVPGTSLMEQWARTSSAFDNPRIDDAGNMVFGGILNNAGPGNVTNGNRRGVWYGGPGAVQMIARDGNIATTLPNPNGWQLNNNNATTAGLQSTPTLSPNGTLFIGGALFGTGSTATNNTAFWTGMPGSLAIVAQRGVVPTPNGTAPGTGGLLWNTNLNLGTSQFGVNDSGQVMFQSSLLPREIVSVGSLVGNAGTVTATTATAHGYTVGLTVVIAGASPAGYNGTYVVASVPTTTSFTYANATTATATGTITSSTGRVTTLTADSGVVTATTANAHGYTAGTVVSVAGATPAGYNGTFAIIDAPTSTTFTYANATTGAATGTITATSGSITAPPADANDNGLWLGSPSGIQLVMRRNDNAPGIADAKLDSGPTFSLLVNNAGHIAFVSKLKVTTGTPTTVNDQVIWTGTPGNLTPVAREGDFLPADLNMPDVFYVGGDPLSLMTQGGLSNDNTVYYSARISGAGITANVNDLVLISYNPTTSPQYTLILQRNDPTGLTDVNFGGWNFTSTRMNNSGTVLFGMTLQGPAVNTNNDGSFWVKPAGQAPVLVAREGDLINLPDLPADATFTSVPDSTQSGLNALGQVVFPARFTGTGIPAFGGTDTGVFAWDPTGGLMLVARLGDSFGFVTAATQITANPVNNGAGTCAGFSDTGWLALIVGNSNTGNYGVYRTRVVPQASCCFLDGTCAMTTQANCPVGGLWRSDITECPMQCPPIGKCCYVDGSCAIRFQANCTGSSWTEGLNCDDPCPLPGACCSATTGLCTFVPESLCQAPDIWTAGMTCADVQCLGSCCDPAYGSCMISLKVDCVAPKIWTLGGTCSPNSCAQPVGACCMPDGSCQQLTPVDCDSAGSVRWTPGNCGTCPGKPSLIKHGLTTNASGISPDGLTITSPLYHADTQTSPVHKYARGTGYSELSSDYGGGVVRCTNNATVLACDQIDAENRSGLSPAFNKLLAKRWTPGGGWAYLGTTGVPTNANQCDATINGTDGFSDDGRFIVVSGWSGSQCGPFKIWRFDNTQSAWAELPRSATGTQDRAYAMSADGNTIVGWDQTNQSRNAAVWRFSLITGWTVTILDSNPAQSEVYAVNNNGTVIAGYMSSAGMTAAFGTTARTPIRWTLSGSTWIRTNLGGVDGMIPTRVSNDGNTIMGIGGTVSDAWIWQPHMSEPMDIVAYLTRTGVDMSSLGITFGAPLTRGFTGMSRDGSAFIGAMGFNTPCLETFGGGLVYLNGTGVPCEPPRIVYPPVSQDYNSHPFFGGILNCLNGGTLNGTDSEGSVIPLTYQWQKQDPNDPQNWIDLDDDNCNNFDYYLVKGSHGPQLRIGGYNSGSNNDLSEQWGTYRCVVTNACGSVTTTPATLRFGGACCFPDGSCRILFQSSTNPFAPGCTQQGGSYRGDYTTCVPNTCPQFILADMNCDGVADGDDIDGFILAVMDPAGYMAAYPGCNIMHADCNNDSQVNTDDVTDFANLLSNQ